MPNAACLHSYSTPHSFYLSVGVDFPKTIYLNSSADVTNTSDSSVLEYNGHRCFFFCCTFSARLRMFRKEINR